RILKPYHGDLFGHTENTMGIIYLSRYDMKRGNASTGVASSKKKFNSFVDGSLFAAAGDAADSDDGSEGGESRSSSTQNERRIGIAEQLYKYSTQPGIEENMIEEGTLEALDDFAHMDDYRAQDCCAAILANLTVASELCNPILDAGITTDVVIPLHSKSNLPESAKRGLAHTLYRFSLLDDKVLQVFREASDVMIQLMKSEHSETKVCAAAALVNVTGAMVMQTRNAGNSTMAGIAGDERQRIVEIVMPHLKDVVSSSHPGARAAAARAFKNFSMYENARLTMIEQGVCESILRLVTYPDLDSYRIDIVTCVANLTNAVEGRVKMIQDGIVSCVVKLGNDADTDENKKLVACAMANLTGVPHNILGHVVMNGAARSLVSLCKVVDNFDSCDTIDIRVASGLANLTVHTSSVLKLVSSDVHTALMTLAKEDGTPTMREVFDLVDSDGQGSIDVSELGRAMGLLGVSLDAQQTKSIVSRFDHDDSGVLEFSEFKALVKFQAEEGQAIQLRTRQILVAIGLCNILSDFNSHEVMVESKVIECLRALTDLNDPKVNVYVAQALGNLVANPDMRAKLSTSEVFDEWMELIDLGGVDTCKVCGKALVHMTFDAMFKTDVMSHMIDKGILKAVNKMVAMNDAQYLDRHCATIVCNLLIDEGNHEKLIASGILETIDKLTSNWTGGHIDVLHHCGAALERLSASLVGDKVAGLISSLSILLTVTNDPLVTHYVSVAFFELSSREDCKQMLAEDVTIHKLLIGMMRGAPGDTQIHGAKALCNLTCDEGCAELLLKTGHVSDFVVIAILRTNSPLIKEICAQSLFNLLHHEKCRNEMVETGVLWALMKLSKIASKSTQNICAKVLFNFSCYETMQARIMEHGVARLLGIAQSKNSEGVDIEDSQTKQFCAGALCNLAFRPEAGALYAKGGAIDFMKDLMEEDDEDNEMYCATILYNLSHCDISSRASLVEENAVPLIVNLSRSEKQRTVIASLGSSYNLSLCVEARKEMVSEDLVPAVMSCVEHAETMDLVCLGIASVYHLTCDRKGHDKDSCLHLGRTECTKRFVGVVVKHGGDKMVSRLCSRILLNMALENENHATMVEEGVLEAVKALQAIGGEELENATKIFSVLANSEAVLASMVDHETFDVYCTHMLEGVESGGEDGMEKLLILSQIFLNVSLSNACRMSLAAKGYFEKVLSTCSLKSETLNMNVVGCIKVLSEDPKVKDVIMKTSAAGILSKVSQATSNAECKGLCGKILNGMSGRRSTVTYSEGSIVAVLSTF
ncbi:hypothetical protein TrRE_jg9620, partial [Triparma retinervis]